MPRKFYSEEDFLALERISKTRANIIVVKYLPCVIFKK